jgi:phosphatidylinositol glycan class M
VLAGWQLWRLVTLQRAPPRAAAAAAALWLCNPFTFTISTRGSCDALVACLLLSCLIGLAQGRLLGPALLYGLAVHLRIYPIIYAPAAVLFLARRRLELGARRRGGKGDAQVGAAARLRGGEGGSAETQWGPGRSGPLGLWQPAS